MRWMVRLLITWVILGALGYGIGLPYAAKLLQRKTQEQTMAQCQQQLADQHLVNAPNAPLKPQQADQFCHCLADPLTLTRDDLIAVLQEFRKTGQRLPPARIAVQMQTQVDTCNKQLQQVIMHSQPDVIQLQ